MKNVTLIVCIFRLYIRTIYKKKKQKYIVNKTKKRRKIENH